jgi:tetratricopeptide (TPR) repeat protein
MLSNCAFCLRALGRLTEALEPMRTALETLVSQQEWKNAAASATNLSELELTLGLVNSTKMGGVEVAGAVGDAKRSVIYGERSGDAFMREVMRTTHANALHQAGRRAEAETLFCEAEQLQAERQPAYPLLYSLQGFRYCDLLLAAPERAAWQMTLELQTQALELETSIESCHAVSLRAEKMFAWRLTGDPLLDIALDHLTLGRAALYEVVLAGSSLPLKTQDSKLKTSIDTAVDSLRRASTQEFIVPGLLTRAWLRFLTGARIGPKSAQSDLDEAWEISERGPMRLHMADIHLYRGRLFHGVKPYPWTSPQEDLAAARKLIEQCGYWRRKEELEDAEGAAKNW